MQSAGFLLCSTVEGQLLAVSAAEVATTSLEIAGCCGLVSYPCLLAHTSLCPFPGVPLKRKVAEFRVTPDALLPVGHELRASHFVAGQFVDVAGTSIGKGFQVRGLGC